MNPEAPNEGEGSLKPLLDDIDEGTAKLTPFVPTFEETRSAIEINPDYLDETPAGREQRARGKK